jgi:protein translocase SecG subunit
MKSVLIYIHLIVSILLIASVLLQQKGQALGSAFGGDSSFYSTKRGIQKTLYWSTIILAIIFIALSLINLIA